MATVQDPLANEERARIGLSGWRQVPECRLHEPEGLQLVS
jgi:hypothetical protein